MAFVMFWMWNVNGQNQLHVGLWPMFKDKTRGHVSGFVHGSTHLCWEIQLFASRAPYINLLKLSLDLLEQPSIIGWLGNGCGRLALHHSPC